MAEAGDTKHIWDAIGKIRIAMLTVEEEGRLVSRPMASLVRPEEGRIYFVTRTDAKVGEIGGSAPVNLAYADPHKNDYVSVAGTARTSQDREKLRELWSYFTEAWLPQGPDGEDVALVTVEPEEAKLWNATSSDIVYAAKVLKAVVTQSPPDGGRVEEVSMGGGDSSEGTPTRKDFEAYDEAVAGDREGLVASSAGGPTA
ncbi:MAG: pyridoxamine 5'-phosphate oxidase family protein [Allosphingosinicella sp.]